MLAIDRSSSFASGFAIAAAMMAAPAMAQEVETRERVAEEDRLGGLEEIVVVARKVEENLQNVPIAVTAFSGAALEQQNATRVSDIARLTPSLAIRESNGAATAPAITLRGQVQTDVLATLDPSVGTYVDGVYWSRAYGLNSDLLDVRSVQVLKGPQGTLFGRNTTGGAILLETNNPDLNSFSGLLSGTYGRFDEMMGTAVVNLPLISDRLAIRAAVLRSRRDGYQTNTATGTDFSNRDNWTGRVKLLAQMTDNLSLLLSAEIYDANLNSPGRKLAYLVPGGRALSVAGAAGSPFIANSINDPNVVSLSEDSFVATRTHTYGGTLNLDTFFGSIKFIGAYRDVDSRSSTDQDGSPFVIHSGTQRQSLSQASGEMQLTGKAFADRIDFALGAFYFHEAGIDSAFSRSTPSLVASDTYQLGDIDNDSIGVYGQATWHITDLLSFTGGLRYSIDDKGITTRNRAQNRTTGVFTCSIASAAPAPDCSFERKNDFAGISYTAGFDYKLGGNSLVYIKTSRGFRSGGQNLRASSLINAVSFEPEIVTAHEAGLKSELFDRRLRINAAAYYSRTSNAQRSTIISNPPPTPGSSTILGNAAKVRIYGIEAEVTALLFEGFQIAGTGSLTKPKYLSYTDLSGDRSSERFDSVPKWTWSASASYTRDLSFGRINARTDYSWIDSQALNSCSLVSTGARCDAATIKATTAPSAGILSARASLSFADDRLEVAVFGRNLTDNRGATNALYVAPPALGYVAQLFREPRTYGVTGTFRFGDR